MCGACPAMYIMWCIGDPPKKVPPTWDLGIGDCIPIGNIVGIITCGCIWNGTGIIAICGVDNGTDKAADAVRQWLPKPPLHFMKIGK